MLVTLMALGSLAQTTEKMDQKIGIIEIVRFKVKPGISEKEAREKLLMLDECVATFDGFIERKLSLNENDEWIDIVYWIDKSSAIKAAEEVMKIPKALEAFSIIDERTMQMDHFDLQHNFKNNNSTLYNNGSDN